VESVEQVTPEIGSIHIMVNASAGNMGEDTLAFLHHCEPGEFGGIDEG
jgi:hypothetical protein